MTRFSIPLLVLVATLGGATSAFAQGSGATPWELKPDTGYGYDKDGKTFSYKMGTNNAGALVEGRQEGAEGHAVLHRPQRPALHAHRAVSRRRRKFMFGSD